MNTRLPAVSGTLYESDTQRLFAQVEAWLDGGIRADVPEPPKAIIVPHSGFHSSGVVAASAYRLLEPVYDQIHRVIILGTSHYSDFQGLSLPAADSFQTPLGKIELDQEAISQLKGNPNIEVSCETHRQEHSIELQLPFLQTALEHFSLIPLVVGDCSAQVIAGILESLWGGSETIIIVSSGLSRKLSLDKAEAQDAQTAQHILSSSPDLTYADACGYSAINGLLEVINRKNLNAKKIELTNSFETCGQKENVRGFGTFAFY